MFRKGRPLSPWLHFGLHFGVILGAKFATILLFGGPGVQIGRKKGESKKTENKFIKEIRLTLGKGGVGPSKSTKSEGPEAQHGPSNTPLRALGARWRIHVFKCTSLIIPRKYNIHALNIKCYYPSLI